MPETIGEIAVRLGFVSRDRLDEALRIQAKLPTPMPLGEILLQRRLITREQLEAVLNDQRRQIDKMDPLARRHREAEMFGRLAVQMGFITQKQLDEALLWLEASKSVDTQVSSIMISKKMLTQQQVNEIMSRQQRVPMMCRACNVKFTIVTISDKKQVPCPRCGKMLEPMPVPDRPSQLPEKHHMTQLYRAVRSEIPVTPTRSKPKMVKAKCVICNREFEGVLDSDDRVICPHCSTSFPYGT